MRRLALPLLVWCCGCPDEPARKPTRAEALVKQRVEQEKAANPAPPSVPSLPSVPTAAAPSQPPRPRPAPGDFVEYQLAVSATQRGLRVGGDRSTSARGVVRLQAIEVTPQRTLVHVSSPDLEVFGAGVLFEVLESGTASYAHPTGGTEEQVLIEGTAWSCLRTSRDASAGDGPRSTECSGSQSPALRLGDGVVSSSSTSMGMGGSSSESITLLRAGNAGLPPSAPMAFPAGTWWEQWGVRREVTSAGGLVVLKSGTQRSAEPLLRFLLQVLSMVERPRVPADAKPARLKVGSHTLDVLVFQTRGSPLERETVEVSVVAEPKTLEAPLPVRFGVLRWKSGTDEELSITDWN